MLHTEVNPLTLSLGRSPFIIVDKTFTVQAISRLTEVALRMEEADVIGFRLEEVLIAADGQNGFDLERTLSLEQLSQQPDDLTFELHTVRDPESRFAARVATCGPPDAALLVLREVFTESEETTDSLERALFGSA